jgi:SHS2 domain-containing protein
MMSMPPSGFEEIDHTADWALRVWGRDLDDLFHQAALGMYFLMETRLSEPESEPVHHRLELEAGDPESLLVAFLSDLLYLDEVQGLAFDRFDFHPIPGGLAIELQGARIVGQTRLIKAVTFHGLEIVSSEMGLEAKVVFDV